MQWNDLNEFWHMGGYGAYVWSAYLITALSLAAELWLVARSSRSGAQGSRQPGAGGKVSR